MELPLPLLPKRGSRTRPGLWLALTGLPQVAWVTTGLDYQGNTVPSPTTRPLVAIGVPSKAI